MDPGQEARAYVGERNAQALALALEDLRAQHHKVLERLTKLERLVANLQLERQRITLPKTVGPTG